MKPKAVAYASDVVAMTSRLLRSEKILSFEILVIPVMMPRQRQRLVLNVLLKKLLRKSAASFQ